MSIENATQAPAQEKPLCPLAGDADGNPVEIPAHAIAWRVRKLATRAGRPKLIFDVETGRPLELALSVTADQLREHVNEPGRYRLEAVDREGRLIPGCIGIAEICFLDESEDEPPMPIAPSTYTEQLLKQLIESNTRVTEALASRFALIGPAEPMSASPITIAPPANGPVAANSTIETVMKIAMEFGAQYMQQFMQRQQQANAAAATAPMPNISATEAS